MFKYASSSARFDWTAEINPEFGLSDEATILTNIYLVIVIDIHTDRRDVYPLKTNVLYEFFW